MARVPGHGGREDGGVEVRSELGGQLTILELLERRDPDIGAIHADRVAVAEVAVTQPVGHGVAQDAGLLAVISVLLGLGQGVDQTIIAFVADADRGQHGLGVGRRPERQGRIEDDDAQAVPLVGLVAEPNLEGGGDPRGESVHQAHEVTIGNSMIVRVLEDPNGEWDGHVRCTSSAIGNGTQIITLWSDFVNLLRLKIAYVIIEK